MNVRRYPVVVFCYFKRSYLWRWVAVPFLLFTLLWFVAYHSAQTFGGSPTAGSYLEYILFCFKGLPAISSVAWTQRIELPVSWICIFSGSALCALEIVDTQADCFTLQLITRVGSRRAWWLCNCSVCAVLTIAYFAVAYLVFFFLCIASGISFSLTSCIVLANYLLNTEVDGSLAVASLLAFVVPPLFSIFLNLLQLTANLFISKSLSFMLSLSYLIVSSFFSSKLAVGNYAMVARSVLVRRNGLNPREGVLVLAFLILILIVVGTFKAGTIDLLDCTNERG